MSSTDEVKTYILEVPGTEATVNALMTKIFDDNHIDGQCIMDNQNRIKLRFGTCSLLCQDEAERREYRDKVTIGFALQVLFDAKQSI